MTTRTQRGTGLPMKVLLCLPPGGFLADKDGLMPTSGLAPLGLASMAAVLEQHDVAVEILDAHAQGLSLGKVRKFLQRVKPDVVGVTFTTESRGPGFRFIRAARQALPRAWIVAGGPHVTFAAQDTLGHVAELDAVCRGEGEYTLRDAVAALERGTGFKDVAGISYRQDNRVIHNPPRPFIQDLDTLPLPARHLLDMKLYERFVIDLPGRGPTRFTNLMSSRGCPIGCCFCSASAMWGQRFRARSPRKVVEEIETVVAKHGVEGVWFFDDSFAMNRSRVHAICDLLLQTKLDVPWLCDARVDTVDEPLLARMKEAGCHGISFGVETGSERILGQVLGKHITLERVRQVKAWCEKVGLRPRWLFMVGLPTETLEEARLTLDLMEELSGDSSLGVLKVYPGTRLEQLAREKGILPDDFTWTRKAERRVVSAPAVAGDAPLFTDRLTWKEISEILLRYAEMNGCSLRGRILPALRAIRSVGDLKRLVTLGSVHARRRLFP
jgi:radical SAM superfamily enzyme YgiQ (UPF0313 family)